MGRYRQPQLGVDRQYALLKLHVPHGHGHVRRGRLLVWRWQVQPTPVSRVYTAKLEYAQHDIPKVHIELPDLCDLAGEKRIPHLYDQEHVRLCLYLPGSGEWTHHKPLASTFVPWTALWLFFFEEWLVSDDWKGGGVHPEDKV